MWLYSLLLLVVRALLAGIGLFNPKIKALVLGRRQLMRIVREGKAEGQWLWFHAASLGEFEQGLPLMQALKKNYPQHQILVTFFSPSGYQVRRKHPLPDAVQYLPWDTPSQVNAFLQHYHPQAAFFIKYEFWPQLLDSLHKRQIPTYLISGQFRPNQLFFKWYGGFMRRRLARFTHVFVQNDISAQLLHTIGITQVTVSGDTRYDRVSATVENFSPIEGMEAFAQGYPVLIAGSSWPPEEALLIKLAQQINPNIKWIVAPHRLNEPDMQQLAAQLPQPCVRFSQRDQHPDWTQARSLLVDTVGHLSRLYHYGHLAFVGGGFGHSGLHNILEPAAFGLPVLFGPNHQKFPEAAAMIATGAALEINDFDDFAAVIHHWLEQPEVWQKKSETAVNFVQQQRGATQKVIAMLHKDKKM